MLRSTKLLGVALCASLSVSLAGGTARAEAWVHRDLTPPAGTFTLDLGFGVGHVKAAPDDLTGVGFAFGGSYALRSNLELGVDMGVRFGNEGPPTQADHYGRPFDTENYERSPEATRSAPR
jgi:hypothetical protein